MAILGLFLLFYEKAGRRARWFVLGFSFFSFLAVCPGWYFRGHYFLLLLPAAGLLAGVTAEALCEFLGRLKFRLKPPALVLLFFAGMVAWSLYASGGVLVQQTPRQASRTIFGPNPFPELVVIGNYLATNCPPDGQIAVMGSEPELCFYSHRRSATGYIYTYPLMEPQPYAVDMQKEMIQEIENASPEYVVFVYDPLSWLQSSNSPTLIMDWFEHYRRKHLDLVAWAEMQSSDHTEYHWSVEQKSISTRSKYWLAIFKKRNPVPPDAPAQAR
jgi:hypothetical protein